MNHHPYIICSKPFIFIISIYFNQNEFCPWEIIFIFILEKLAFGIDNFGVRKIIIDIYLFIQKRNTRVFQSTENNLNCNKNLLKKNIDA